MDIQAIFHSDLFTWVVLPVLIFLARILDVTIGTLRIMFLARGHRIYAPILGFFEVFIWLMAIGQIMQNLDNIFCYIAYAAGFATGNYIGIRVEERLAMGKQVLRLITRREATELVGLLRRRGFGVTVVDAEGKQGPVKILFMVVKRSDIQPVLRMVNKLMPRTFYTIEDTRQVQAGIFRKRKGFLYNPMMWPVRRMKKKRYLRRLGTIRKGK
jgi:uncharacterized protein YebE (UPF0316 family)